jgi:hypothetical protein
MYEDEQHDRGKAGAKLELQGRECREHVRKKGSEAYAYLSS